MDEQEEKIKDIVKNTVKTYGAEIVDLKISTGGHKFIRGLVDYPAGGITLGICSQINQKIVEDLNASGMDCSVEINSPGLDRPLKEYKDFLRVKGRTVLLWLREPVYGRNYLEAEVSEVSPEKLFLSFKNEPLEILLSNINTGREKIR